MSQEPAAAAAAAADTAIDDSAAVQGSSKPKIVRLDAKDCPIDTVTVFCDSAQIVRNVKVTFDAPGLHDVIIEGLTQHTKQESLHVSGGVGAATVLEVLSKSVVKVREECHYDDKEKEADDARLKELQQKLKTLQIQRQVTERSLKWLKTWADKVRSTPWNQAKSDPTFLTAPYIENVRNFGKFFAEETLKHSARQVELGKSIAEVNQEISAIQTKRRMMENSTSAYVKSVSAIVSLAVQKATTVQFQVKYLVRNAQWSSAYDCRVSSEGTMSISYYGEIVNLSDEMWDHVHLFLSTASPSVGGHPGELRLATVSIARPAPIFSRMMAPMMGMGMGAPMGPPAPPAPGAPPPPPSCFGASAPPPPPPMKVLTATSSKSLASCTFAVNRKATIPSDSEKHRVTVTIIPDLPTKLNYVCTPSETEHLFLKASAVNKTEFPLLEGPCSTFIDGSFVASSTLKYTAIGEPFKFFLGTDQEIRVKYVKPFRVDDKAGIIMKSSVQKFNGSIELRNSKSLAVNVTVLHPLPKSDNAEIKVALAEPKIEKDSTAVKINAKNMIRWKSKIEPGETCKMPIVYTITYPQGKDVYFHT